MTTFLWTNNQREVKTGIVLIPVNLSDLFDAVNQVFFPPFSFKVLSSVPYAPFFHISSSPLLFPLMFRGVQGFVAPYLFSPFYFSQDRFISNVLISSWLILRWCKYLKARETLHPEWLWFFLSQSFWGWNQWNFVHVWSWFTTKSWKVLCKGGCHTEAHPSSLLHIILLSR